MFVLINKCFCLFRLIRSINEPLKTLIQPTDVIDPVTMYLTSNDDMLGVAHVCDVTDLSQ